MVTLSGIINLIKSTEWWDQNEKTVRGDSCHISRCQKDNVFEYSLQHNLT